LEFRGAEDEVVTVVAGETEVVVVVVVVVVDLVRVGGGRIK